MRDLSKENPEAELTAMDAKWYRLASLDSAIVSMNDGSSAALYQRDPAHYRELLKKTMAIHGELRREWPRLAAEYRAALGDITSPEAWEKTLSPWTGTPTVPTPRRAMTEALEPERPRDAASRAAALADVPLISPAPVGGLRGIVNHRYLLKLLVKREVTARYTGSFLGMLWSYINPLTQFLMYMFIFALLMGRGENIENFAIHVFAALMVVSLFTETVAAGTRSIVRNASLLQKSAMPREMFPFASLLVSIYHLWPEFVILGAALVFVGWSPDLTALAAGLLGYRRDHHVRPRPRGWRSA